MKRVLSILIAVIMIAAIFTACGTKDTSSTTTTTAPASTEAAKVEEKAPVELTLWVASRERGDFEAKILEGFRTQYPYITVNEVVHEGDPGNDYFQGIAAGNAPDCVYVSYAMLPKYITAGVTVPLNNYVKDWADYQYFLKDEQAKFTDKDGNIHSIVSDIGVVQLGYNKKLFAEAGITAPPKTWDELLADAKLLTKPEKQQAGYGLLISEFPDWPFEYFVWQAGGDFTKKNDDGSVTLTFADPAAIKASEFLRQLVKEKVIQSDLSLNFGGLVNGFATGKIAMMPFAGDWVSWAVSEGAKAEEIGLSLMPAGPSGQMGLGNSYGGGWIINPNASKEKQDAAWEYIKWYTSKDYFGGRVQDWAKNGALNPVPFVRTDLTFEGLGVTLNPEWVTFLDEAVKTSKPEYYGRADFGNYLSTAIQKILLDQKADPVKEFTAAQELATKEALEKFNKDNSK